MNHPFVLLIGAILSIGLSWNTLIVNPQKHFGQLTTQDEIPKVLNGQQKQGRQVYAESGCVKCHTQQVRYFEQDSKYGPRFTVANDFAGQDKPLLGSHRIGPDLSNLGNNGKYTGGDGRMNLYKTLFHAKESQVMEGSSLASLMPRHYFLFDKVELSSLAPDNEYSELARELGETAGLEEGHGYIPSYRAEVLADYLMSLKLDQSLFVAPIQESSEE